MIICLCRGVSDRDVRSAIQRGAKCVRSLESSGIGGDCRGCEQSLVEMIRATAGADPDACQSCCNASVEVLATA